LSTPPLGDGEVLQRRQMRDQVRGLEDHADLAADRVDVDIWVGHLHAADEDRSRGRLLEAVDAAQQGRFAGPGRTDDTDDFASV
jgi:hypothetical protein